MDALEVLQTIFYLLWIVILSGVLVFVIAAFMTLMYIRKMAEKTFKDVQFKSEEVKVNIERKVDDFFDSLRKKNALTSVLGLALSAGLDKMVFDKAVKGFKDLRSKKK